MRQPRSLRPWLSEAPSIQPPKAPSPTTRARARMRTRAHARANSIALSFLRDPCFPVVIISYYNQAPHVEHLLCAKHFLIVISSHARSNPRGGTNTKPTLQMSKPRLRYLRMEGKSFAPRHSALK